ncbi:MAG: ABC transporter ATP-binding protein [Pseudomonadota bacterium]
MSDSIIEAKNLSVSRGGASVLSGINFKIEKGECFALLGGNGAGKSTTLLAFLGFLKLSGGHALAFGAPVDGNVKSVREKIAYLPEAATLYGHLTAKENLSYFLSLAGVARSDSAIDAALDRVALQPDARHRRMENYSKGMRQKTAIALALLRETPVLFLDEPTSGLDPVAIDEFNRLVTELSSEGVTILMVTHDVYGACQAAHRIALLRRGALVGEFSAPDGGKIDTEAVHRAFAEKERERSAA